MFYKNKCLLKILAKEFSIKNKIEQKLFTSREIKKKIGNQKIKF